MDGPPRSALGGTKVTVTCWPARVRYVVLGAVRTLISVTDDLTMMTACWWVSPWEVRRARLAW